MWNYIAGILGKKQVLGYQIEFGPKSIQSIHETETQIRVSMKNSGNHNDLLAFWTRYYARVTYNLCYSRPIRDWFLEGMNRLGENDLGQGTDCLKLAYMAKSVPFFRTKSSVLVEYTQPFRSRFNGYLYCNTKGDYSVQCSFPWKFADLEVMESPVAVLQYLIKEEQMVRPLIDSCRYMTRWYLRNREHIDMKSTINLPMAAIQACFKE